MPIGHQDRAAADDATGFAHAFETRVKDEVGILPGERTTHKAPQLGLKLHRDRRDRAGPETVAAKFLRSPARTLRVEPP